jgi:L-asparaginase
MNISKSSTEKTWCLALLVLFLSLPCGSASRLPRIRILATGGTIAGTQANRDAAGYSSGTLTVEDLIQAVPQVKGLAEISGEQVSNIGSQSMNNRVWLKLGKRLNEVLADPSVDGVVITHGTDTMEETAYFLSLIAKSDKPIVMTGAMRPATETSADGPMNLYSAITLATNHEVRGRGVVVVLNDEIHYAREVEKTSTTRLNAFDSPNRGRAGVIHDGKAVLFSPAIPKYGLRSEFSIDGLTELPRVEIVYSYANLGRDMIDYLVREGVKGIVLAGVGDGNTTDEALAGLQDARKKGVMVVRSSRVESGITRREVEVDDGEMGFIASEELTPQKARILLMLGLTKTNDTKKLQNYFYEY